MANYGSTYGSRSRRAGSGEVVRTPVTCEVGPSSEDVVGESSGCNAITDTSIIAKLLADQLLTYFGDPLVAREPTDLEKEISQRLFKTTKALIENEFFGSMDIEITANVEENELEEDPDYNEKPSENAQCGETEQTSDDTMKYAVEAYDKAKRGKLKAARKYSRKVTSYKVIERWRQYLAQGGSTRCKQEAIRRYVWSQFIHRRRNLRVAVHDRDLKIWAMEKANDVGLDTFKASRRYIFYFKDKHKIKSRKVTHTVTRKDAFPEVSLLPVINTFREDLKNKMEQKQYKLSNVLNTDQSGYVYEYVTKRTLDFQGIKEVNAAVNSKSKTTHSYTIQLTISAAGNLVGPVLIITQESKGQFGPHVHKRLQEMSYSNVVVMCSKSGKSTKELNKRYYEILKASIGNEPTMLILDQWSGQKDQEIIIRTLGENVEPVFLPPGTTKYLQPLDVQTFHDYKYFVKRLVEYSSTHPAVCDQEDLTTREAIITIHHLVYNQLAAPVFNDMRRYAFQRALLQIEIPSFRSVKQACFEHLDKTCGQCENQPFLKCAWCQEPLCFIHFYKQQHYHG